MPHQDTNYIILLVKNRRMSVGKNSKHTKNQVVLITYKVTQGELEVLHKGAV